MSGDKVYILSKIRIAPQFIKEYDEKFVRDALPFWVANGARMVGAFAYSLGGPIGEEFRIWEFKDFASWEQLEKNQEKSREWNEEVKKVRSQFVQSVENCLLKAIYGVEGGISREKIYILSKIRIAPQFIKEYDEKFVGDALPFWVANGARMVGAFTYSLGGPIGEEFRIWEFKDFASWELLEKNQEKSREWNEEVKKVRSQFVQSVENCLLKAIYDV
jgi:hypothetical protein